MVGRGGGLHSTWPGLLGGVRRVVHVNIPTRTSACTRSPSATTATATATAAATADTGLDGVLNQHLPRGEGGGHKET